MLANDPVILLSIVNTKLRDFYPSLDALCRDLSVSMEETEEKLRKIGYVYDGEKNRFVPS